LASFDNSLRRNFPFCLEAVISFLPFNSFIWAILMGHPVGCAINVLVWIASPADGGHASMRPALAMQAESGNPPVRALPRHTISGTVWVWSHANHSPVRPKPV